MVMRAMYLVRKQNIQDCLHTIASSNKNNYNERSEALPTDEMAEEKPSKRQQIPAASTTQVPTMSTVHSVKRCLSYSDKLSVEEQAANPEALTAAVKSDKKEEDRRSSENMIKAALTELLNDQDIKNNPEGNKCVQNLLMKTEKERRKQRRKSVHERGPDQTRN
jgi:hypothetical protein